MGLLRHVAGEPEQHRELSQDGGSAAPELTSAGTSKNKPMYCVTRGRNNRCGLPRVTSRACGYS